MVFISYTYTIVKDSLGKSLVVEPPHHIMHCGVFAAHWPHSELQCSQQ